MRLPFALLLLALAAPASRAQPPPFQPKVDDPMLTPVPPAPQQVTSWGEALTRVKERSTPLQSAEAGVERAAGRSRQALSALLPNARLSAGVAVDLLNPDTPVTSTGTPVGAQVGGDGRAPTAPLGTATVSVTQSLVDVGAWRGRASARAAEEGAVATLQDTRRRLTLGVARILVSTVAAERAAEINRVGLRQALERAALTQRSFELGASNQLDVVRVSQDVAVARGTLVSGDE